MSSARDLGLHEEILLLALKDEEGTPTASMYAYAVGGAILAELMLQTRIRLVPRRHRKALLEAVEPAPAQLHDPVLRAVMEQVRTARRRANVVTWVGRFGRREHLRATARSLVHKGILRVQEKRILLVFNRTVYPELDPGPERALIERLRTAIFDDDPVDDRTSTLLGIAHAGGLLAPIFGRKALKPRKRRIEALARGDVASEATRATIEAVQAAVIAATTAATASSAAT